MTRVDFYILEDVEQTALLRFGCRLAARALDSGNRVYLHTENDASARNVDEMLWAYPSGRFIPHSCQEEERAMHAPILIGWNEPMHHDQVLINLSNEVPGFFGRFDRVAEIIVKATTEQGRERYRFYRDRGFPLFDHKLGDWEK